MWIDFPPKPSSTPSSDSGATFAIPCPLVPFSLLTLVLFLLPAKASSQAIETAERASRLSVFGGFTGSYTDLDNGRNMSFTAGSDWSFPRLFGLVPSIEIRGTYPFNDGQVVGVKDILGGLKLQKKIHRFTPYVDFLGGEGELTYDHVRQNFTNTWHYTHSYSGVWAAGLGTDYQLTRNFALNFDGQLVHFDSPMTASGVQWVKAGTIGVRYTFPFRHSRRGPNG